MRYRYRWAVLASLYVCAGYVAGVPVLLAKPQTYMNLSGESVGPLSTYYKIPVERVLVIYDDLDLEFAVMRLLPKGGHGGHNGLVCLQLAVFVT
jgi:PTH1 family peptidyl-tRNA hydrolase